MSTPKQRLSCGCPATRDESAQVFAKQATQPGDIAYCPKHGDVRLEEEAATPYAAREE